MHRRLRRVGLCAGLSLGAGPTTVAIAAEPEDTVEIADDDEPATDASASSDDEPAAEDEAPPSEDSASDDDAPEAGEGRREGDEPPEDDGKKKKKTKKARKAKADGAAKGGDGASEVDQSAWPSDRWRGQRYRDAEMKKKWIRRWAPERDELDVGLFLGGMILPERHGLFDAGEGPRPTLARGAFDVGFRIAYMPLRFLGVGLETGFAPTRSGSENADVTATAFRMHVIGQLPYRITPTVVIGGGFIAVSSQAAILRELDSAFMWGAGLKIHANQWIAVRLDGRHIAAPGNGEGDRASYGEILVGVDVTLRMRRLVKPRKIDRDDDGLYDRDDACPFEAADTDDGCPANKDSDGDGVPNKTDACPKEYGDDPKGCPIPDKDGDGILDGRDDCFDQPETVNGFQDTDGCPDEEPERVKKLTGVIAGITFDSGQATIRKTSRKVLDDVVATMKEYEDVRIEIVGHTDDQGKRETNVALSASRAEAVKAYFVGKGIDGGRITTRGVGPDEPIADNKTKAGRASNRRIEFKVLK
jgi:OOP family OmpA-OmpF porin